MATKVRTLKNEVLDRVSKIGQADILVGIPSFRNAKTIAKVVKAVSEGMVKYFPDLKPVLVNSDGSSTDTTRELVLNTKVPKTVEKIVTPYRGIPGKGSAFATIFEIADRLHTKICIVVDSDLRSITPEWIKFLGYPIYKNNFGIVTPYYKRYKYDGTITNSLAYPLTRALYGTIIRQPIGGEFGMSGSLAKILAHQKFGDRNIAKFGIDIWLTTTAICEGFSACQASMGIKLHDARDPGASLAPMFEQVVGALFGLMYKYQVKWKAIKGSQPVDLYGEEKEAHPVSFRVDFLKLIRSFKTGFKKNESIIKSILQKEVFKEVKGISQSHLNRMHFEDELWAKVVYDFSVAYNFGPVEPKLIIEALVPLYFAKTAAFILRTKYMSSSLAEAIVEGGAEVFEEEKDYLIDHWDRAKKLYPHQKQKSHLAVSKN
ncbi:MAG: glycosyl transferase family 2 [Actinobacteria bacterium]|nr:MAG: glycosyl transferase family 2 [Actinomycetota bacterium]